MTTLRDTSVTSALTTVPLFVAENSVVVDFLSRPLDGALSRALHGNLYKDFCKKKLNFLYSVFFMQLRMFPEAAFLMLSGTWRVEDLVRRAQTLAVELLPSHRSPNSLVLYQKTPHQKRQQMKYTLFQTQEL